MGALGSHNQRSGIYLHWAFARNLTKTGGIGPDATGEARQGPTPRGADRLQSASTSIDFRGFGGNVAFKLPVSAGDVVLEPLGSSAMARPPASVTGRCVRKNTVKVEPRPLRLSTVTHPPCAEASSRTSQSPRPSPPPSSGLACTLRSKIQS